MPNLTIIGYTILDTSSQEALLALEDGRRVSLPTVVDTTHASVQENVFLGEILASCGWVDGVWSLRHIVPPKAIGSYAGMSLDRDADARMVNCSVTGVLTDSWRRKRDNESFQVKLDLELQNKATVFVVVDLPIGSTLEPEQGSIVTAFGAIQSISMSEGAITCACPSIDLIAVHPRHGDARDSKRPPADQTQPAIVPTTHATASKMSKDSNPSLSSAKPDDNDEPGSQRVPALPMLQIDSQGMVTNSQKEDLRRQVGKPMGGGSTEKKRARALVDQPDDHGRKTAHVQKRLRQTEVDEEDTAEVGQE